MEEPKLELKNPVFLPKEPRIELGTTTVAGSEGKILERRDQVRRSPNYVCTLEEEAEEILGGFLVFWVFCLQGEVMFYNLVIISTSYMKNYQGFARP